METRNSALSNIRRVLTQLEKAIGRLLRQNYFYRSQCHCLFEKIENAIKTIREWIKDFRMFISLNSLFIVLSLCIKKLGK